MKTRLMIAGLLVALLLSLGAAQAAFKAEPGWKAWADYYRSQGARIEELPGAVDLLRITPKEGEPLNIYTQIPSNNNRKNAERYTKDTVFMVPIRGEDDWEAVLTFLPVAIWKGSAEDEVWCNMVFKNQKDGFPYTPKCAYPLIGYYTDGTNFDMDSPLHFLEQYGAKRIVHVGPPSPKLRGLLGKYATEGLVETSIDQVFDYWGKYDEIVFVKDDYALAMQAAQYAAYRNAPLVIEGGSLPKGYKGALTCIGAVPEGVACDVLTEEEVIQMIISLTGSDKALILNPNDRKRSFSEDFELVTKKGGKVSGLYWYDSAAGAYLATAKEEIIVPVPLEKSYSISEMEKLGGIERFTISEGYMYASNGAGLIHILKLNEWTGDVVKVVQTFDASSSGIVRVDDIGVHKKKLYVLDPGRYTNTIYVFQLKATGEIEGTPVQRFALRNKRSKRLETGSRRPEQRIEIGGGGVYIPELQEDLSSRQIKRCALSDDGKVSFCSSAFKDKALESRFSAVMPHPSELEIHKDRMYLTSIDIRSNSIVVVLGMDESGMVESLITTFEPKESPDEKGVRPRVLAINDEAEYPADTLDTLYIGDIVKKQIRTFVIPLEKTEKEYAYKKSYRVAEVDRGLLDMEVYKYRFYVARLLGSMTRGTGLGVMDFPSLKRSTQEYSLPDIKPPTMISDIKTAVTKHFGSPKIVNYFTYLASPTAIQFSVVNVLPMGWSDKRGLDFLVTELLSLESPLFGFPSDTPLTSNRRSGVRVKAYGRIFGVTVSDTFAYVCRSVFAERIKPTTEHLITVTIGGDVSPHSYFGELEQWASKIPSRIVCYIDPEAYKGARSAICTETLPKREEYEKSDFLVVKSHGHPSGFYFKGGLKVDEVLGLNLEPLVVFADACSTLDHYTTKVKKHNPMMGVAIVRSGGMGYLGAVTFARMEDTLLYMPIKAVLKEGAPIGESIRVQLGGTLQEERWEDVVSRASWNRGDIIRGLRRSFESYYTLLGDPTYKPVF